MKNNKKLIILIVALIAAICVLLGLYRAFGPKASAGSKNYTVEVVNSEGASKKYEGRTDAEYLKGLMDELVEKGGFSYDGEDSAYGLFITGINGETADFQTDGAYWAIYVNDAYGEYGADQQTVSDGDAFKFVYERSEQ